jgi:Holliday junction resolvase RusA-like endonuclease
VFVFWAEHEGDWDNYGKIVGDACNKILWRDDKQISWGCAWKDKVQKGQERIEVEAWVIGSMAKT